MIIIRIFLGDGCCCFVGGTRCCIVALCLLRLLCFADYTQCLAIHVLSATGFILTAPAWFTRTPRTAGVQQPAFSGFPWHGTGMTRHAGVGSRLRERRGWPLKQNEGHIAGSRRSPNLHDRYAHGPRRGAGATLTGPSGPLPSPVPGSPTTGLRPGGANAANAPPEAAHCGGVWAR